MEAAIVPLDATTTEAAPLDVSWPLYSADDHLDMWALPHDVWTARLSRAHRDDGPRVVPRDGVLTWVVEDRAIGVSGRPTAGAQSALSRAGLDHDGLRPSDPAKRLADMERDGVWASVIYGPSVLRLPIEDPELEAACLRAWNDWAAEFNSNAPDRLVALPVLPRHDPAEAAAELERVAALGHRGALVYCFDIDCGDRAWDRLWAAAQEIDLPLSFHIGGGVRFPVERGTWRTLAFSAVVAVQMVDPLVVMVMSGALERHPGLTVVLAEAGLGWVPYMVNRMDQASERWSMDLGVNAPQLRPSELFGRQVRVTFEEDPYGAQFVRMLPPGTCMWASDYPHADSTFPRSRQAVAETLAGLDDSTSRAVTAGTCRSLYGLA
ncbi:MAG TPA: amidohydrolase family protein [Acidimicrobiales bacterium]|nr:amidohydrolase family protein [Acidimicrobiales bacterium]